MSVTHFGAQGSSMGGKRYDGVVCRGSFVLGSACGRCERCDEERQRLQVAAEAVAAVKPKVELVVASSGRAAPLLFTLVRDEDESGVSGTGTVADGVRWPDGSAVLHWRTQHTSTAVYASMESLRCIHGHGGRTRVVWARGWDESHPFLRGAFHCALDANENAPFGSVGGLGAREALVAPDYIAEADRAEYLAGYRDEAQAMFGDDWRTCSFSWSPVLGLSP